MVPENAAPSRKATDRPIRRSRSPGSTNSNAKTSTAIGANVRICLAR